MPPPLLHGSEAAGSDGQVRHPPSAHQHPHCLDACKGGHEPLADQTAGKLLGQKKRVPGLLPVLGSQLYQVQNVLSSQWSG